MSGVSIRPGMRVTTADGHALGTLSFAGDDELVIAAGDFFQRDQTFLRADILRVAHDGVVLRQDLETMRAVQATPTIGLPPSMRERPAAGDRAAPPDDLRATAPVADDTPGLGLSPTAFENARMDSAKFHGRRSANAGVEPKTEGGTLNLQPRDLERARMDSAHFQKHVAPEIDPRPRAPADVDEVRLKDPRPHAGAARRDPDDV